MSQQKLMSDEEAPVTDNVRLFVARLKMLTDEERKQIFSHFCTNCGSIDPRCQCWNDD